MCDNAKINWRTLRVYIYKTAVVSDQVIFSVARAFSNKKRCLKNGVMVFHNLVWEDRQKKNKLREVMKQAYEEGKKPLFYQDSRFKILYFALFISSIAVNIVIKRRK